MSQLEFFQDIELIGQPEVAVSVVWSKLYTQLHLALAEFKNTYDYQPIGVSFPEYGDMTFPLGKSLRLFASSEDELKKLAISDWLSRLTDYVRVKNIHPIPSKKVREYAMFSRKEFKTNPEAIARRRCKRHPELTFEAALAQIKDKAPRFTDLPYVSLNSLSSGHHFKLFIDHKRSSLQDRTSDFSTYGLSQGSSVPIF